MNRIRIKLERNQSPGAKMGIVWSALRSRNESWSSMQRREKKKEKNSFSEERSVLRDSLTAPTLLEMFGKSK
jgi:hypothetical protein